MRKAADGITYPELAIEPDRDRRMESPNEVYLFGRAVRWEMTRAARAAHARLTAPLLVDMELYFSCFIRKAVRFQQPHNPAAALGDAVRVSEHLYVRFRPVTTQRCAMSAGPDAPPLETLPITRPHLFVPNWLKLDVWQGVWSGEFGY